MRWFLESGPFQERYPGAYARWAKAEQLLWAADSTAELTTIGHLCREALQDFAAVLVNRFSPPSVDLDPARTVSRIKSVFAVRKDTLGDSLSAFTEALVAYWGTVSDLVQRQEHGAQKEGRPLKWEDARRVVFQTIILMFELDRALS